MTEIVGSLDSFKIFSMLLEILQPSCPVAKFAVFDTYLKRFFNADSLSRMSILSGGDMFHCHKRSFLIRDI